VELVGPDHRFERHHRDDFAVVGLGPFAPASFWAQGPTLIAAGTAGAGTDAWIKGLGIVRLRLEQYEYV